MEASQRPVPAWGQGEQFNSDPEHGDPTAELNTKRMKDSYLQPYGFAAATVRQCPTRRKGEQIGEIRPAMRSVRSGAASHHANAEGVAVNIETDLVLGLPRDVRLDLRMRRSACCGRIPEA